ncbi:Sap-like sulfolipid-1-addressing protein [Kribbella steppae]|uniref:Sap-like sulfolipid-1-addressing protein n=1 Tax=Kribbella steppae TaxID=2512223 RepID=A0A4R2GZY4_9ACTN|nr:GAP family protein [Kribbella steppae]TCO17202.1 Sap-like sulfolipid-1-addressing protein [Kribbella steppae]
MNEVIGELLPLAVGVAISPVPIMAAILMLLAPRAGGTSAGFLLGWVAGIAVATGVFTALAGVGFGDSDEPSAAVSWVKIGLGVLLLLLAARQWRARPKPGTAAALPGWMSAMDSFTLPKAAGLGFVLSAVNPKNLLMCVAAGTAIGSGGLSGGGDVVAVAVFTALAASSVAVPVLAYAVARDRLRGPLDGLKQWLQAHNAAVMSVLLLVIGTVLIGKGIGGL